VKVAAEAAALLASCQVGACQRALQFLTVTLRLQQHPMAVKHAVSCFFANAAACSCQARDQQLLRTISSHDPHLICRAREPVKQQTVCTD
jgi:hypothetical protein